MKRVVLPFKKNVEMLAYQNRAFWLGIVKANLENYDMWLCNKLVNCVYWYGGILEPFEEDPWSHKHKMFLEESVDFTPSLFSCQGIDLVTLNKSMLQQNYYIIGNYNERHIPNKGSFGVADFDHDYVIFGYDDDLRVFMSAGYLASGQYDEFTINYDDYLNATITDPKEKVKVIYYKMQEGYEEKIDIPFIREKTENYLFSRWHTSGIESESKFGFEAWEHLANCVEQQEGALDLRLSRFFVEFHGVMMQRIQTLSREGHIRLSCVEETYDSIYKDCMIVHYMFIKYNMHPKSVPRDVLRGRIAERIRRIICDERQAINALLENLQ